jgi:hypothetical protein
MPGDLQRASRLGALFYDVIMLYKNLRILYKAVNHAVPHLNKPLKPHPHRLDDIDYTVPTAALIMIVIHSQLN